MLHPPILIRRGKRKKIKEKAETCVEFGGKRCVRLLTSLRANAFFDVRLLKKGGIVLDVCGFVCGVLFADTTLPPHHVFKATFRKTI